MNIRKIVFGDFPAGRVGWGLLLLRLLAGFAFMKHGWGKIQDPMGWMGPDATTPGIFQALAAISEFVGGLGWILGLLTPLFSLGLLSTMVVATHMHAVVRGDPFIGRGGSYELPLLYLVIALLFLFAGPGRFSLDALLFGRKDSGNRP